MQLKGFTIAAVDMDTMVRFYNVVFTADLQPFDAFGTVLYGGELAGYPLTFCPNSLLQIKADKNRVQLSVYVDDLDATLTAVTTHGGTQLQTPATTQEGRSCGVTDPDGNSIELTERIP